MSVSAVIRCHQDDRIVPLIEDLRSSAREHEIVAVLTETSDAVRALLEQMQDVKTVAAPVGNLSRSTNVGITASRNEKIVVLDSDLRCTPGYLDAVSKALDDHLLVKTDIHFSFAGPLQKIAGDLRKYIHTQGNFYCPGAAFRKELKDKIGGHFFNDAVWWTEDAEMNHRVMQAGLPVHHIHNAAITHEPVDLLYDLQSAWKIGRGKFSQVRFAGRKTFEESVENTMRRICTGESFNNIVRVLQSTSPAVAMYSVLWNFLYYAGYYRDRICFALKGK